MRNRHHRTGHVQRRRAIKLSLLATGALGAVLLAACSPNSEPSGEVAAGPAAGNAIEILAVDTAFGPERLKLRAGKKVTVEITNEGDMPHDFAIDELDLNTGTIEPGQVATATFTVPNIGLDFVCTFHPQMTGRVVVR